MNTQNIEVEIRKAIFQRFSNDRIKKAFELAGNEAILLQQERTMQGLDVLGRSLGNYTYPYHKFKTRFVKGGKMTRSMQKLAAKKNQFAANKVKDYGRLTGELFADMAFRVTGIQQKGLSVFGTIQMFIKERSRKKAEGLQSMVGRNQYVSYPKKQRLMFGIALTGARAAYEKNRLKTIWANTLGISNGNINIR
jgi:hypothetical protein